MTLDEIKQVMHFFNAEQKDAIFCDENCVVTAGAGSGKTSVLTYRFFRLVATGKAEVDQILTLTFTKAAAAQMYERIYTLFVSHGNDEYMKEQLEKFASSTISTIDSFCYRVVLSDMKRFGLSPDFMLDNDASIEIASLCAHQTIEKMKDSPGMKFLSVAYDPETLINEVFVSLAIQHFYIGDEFDPQFLTSLVQHYLEGKKEDAYLGLREIVFDLITAEGRGKVYVSNKELLIRLKQLLEDQDSILHNLEELESIKIKKSSVKEEGVAEYNEDIVDCRTLLPIYISIMQSVNQKETLQEVYEVFSYFHDIYIERKRESQLLTYNDIAHMAHIILSENEEVRKSFASSFRYIMVDEFQDTNPLQKEILYLLSTNAPIEKGMSVPSTSLVKDKLFFVGDEKQSIYRFRGADVRVFKRLYEQIVSSGGRLISLKKNYRSQEHLIGVFNSLFKQVFKGAIEDFEASFTPLEPVKKHEMITPKASLAIIPYQDKDEADAISLDGEEAPVGFEQEAIFIAQRIKEMIEGDEYLIEVNGEIKKPSYNDIAILLRTTSPQMYYEKELRKAHIPYILSSVKSLFLEAPLNDIYIMLQLIMYPDDVVSYASLLRSGFCNLDDNHVIDVLIRGREENQIFGEIEIPISGEKEKYEKVKALYTELVQMSSTSTISSLLTHIWYRGGYRNHLLSSPSYSVYLEHFEYIIELAFDIERKGGNLLTFLDFIRPRLGKSEAMGELEILSHSQSGVNIMTIHKSKGLEFPIVIIANAGGSARVMKTPEVFYHEHEENIIVIPRHMRENNTYKNIVFELEKRSLEKSESAELKRLLYVACTRSEFHLLITSYDNNRNLKDSYIEKNFLSMVYYNSQEALIEGDRQYSLTEETVARVERDNQETISRKTIIQNAQSKEVWYHKSEPEIIYPQRVMGVTSIQEAVADGDKKINPLDILTSYKSDEILEKYNIYTMFGTWTHGVFEYGINHLRDSFTYDENLITKEVITSLIPSSLASISLLDSEKTLMIQDIYTMSTIFFSSQFYHNLITPELQKMESEVPFIARVVHNGETIAVNGIIDLLLEYKDYLLIVDFKTDKIIDPLLHKIQLDVYKSAMKMIYQKEVKAVLCYVRQENSERWV